MVAPGNAPPFHPANARSSDYHMTPPSYPTHPQIRGNTPSDNRISPIPVSVNVKSGSNIDSHRFGGYNSYPLLAYRNTAPPPSKAGLSLEISSESRLKEEFSLPPIQAPDSNNSNSSPYSLPPISSMAEARGITLQDSTAVLRRLRMDDDGYNNKADRLSEERTWLRRHSLSTYSSSSYVFLFLLKRYEETHDFPLIAGP
jgi:hypothetical protein